jgi:hypothetical protein
MGDDMSISFYWIWSAKGFNGEEWRVLLMKFGVKMRDELLSSCIWHRLAWFKYIDFSF